MKTAILYSDKENNEFNGIKHDLNFTSKEIRYRLHANNQIKFNHRLVIVIGQNTRLDFRIVIVHTHVPIFDMNSI